VLRGDASIGDRDGVPAGAFYMGGGHRLKSPVPDLPTGPESDGLGVMGAEPERRAVQELVPRGESDSDGGKCGVMVMSPGR
jgi:hypothetical protein